MELSADPVAVLVHDHGSARVRGRGDHERRHDGQHDSNSATAHAQRR